MSNLPYVPHPSGDPLGASDAQGVPGMPSLALLMETDHLLDRLGDRGPRPSDLDDPLAAALALLAADVDVEPVSADATRRRLASFGAWPLRQDLRSAGLESLAHTIDVRDQRDLRVVGATVDNRAAAWDEDSARDTVDELDEVSGAGRLAQTREVGIRLVPALVAAGAAIVLSMGAAAALSSGEMPNPAKMVKEIVNDLTGDTTSGSGPNGADALAEPQRRGPGAVPSGSSGGSGQPLAPGALPGASVSPTVAPSGTTGADPTSPGGLAPALLDLLPVLPAPTLSTTDGAQPGSSSATSGSGSSGTGASATTSSSTEASSSETTASSEPSESSSSSEPPPESTTSEPTPSVGPTGSTTEPDPTETTSPPPTSPSTDEESASGTGTTEHGASGESAVAQVRPFSDTSPLPAVAYEPPPAVVGTASTSDSATTDPDATTPHQADLFASGGV